MYIDKKFVVPIIPYFFFFVYGRTWNLYFWRILKKLYEHKHEYRSSGHRKFLNNHVCGSYQLNT